MSTHIVMVTGHRQDKLDGWDVDGPVSAWVRASLRAYLMENRAHLRAAISGMALGTDTIFAEECLDLGIPLVAAVAFPNVHERWPVAARWRFQSICDQAASVVVVSPDEVRTMASAAAALHLRSDWMIEHCTVGIAVWDGSDGGTSRCAKRLEASGKLHWRIDPTVAR